MSLIKTLLAEKGGAELVSALLAPPKRNDPAETMFRMSGGYKKGKTHQMDTLFLPEDTTGDKYLLVVVDIGSGKTDAVPMRNKSKKDVFDGLKSIYGWTDDPKVDVKPSSKYISTPKYIHMDNGGEFNNDLLLNFLKRKGIGYRVASTNRHKQMAPVEAMNARIGGAISRIQLNNAMAIDGDDQDEQDWIAFLPAILEAVNTRQMKPLPPPPSRKEPIDCNGGECETYMVGESVRVMLDYPQTIKGERLHGGSFRSADIRWSLKPYTVENVIMDPGQPIRYVVRAVGCDKDNINKKSPFYKNNCPVRNTFSKWELKPYKEYAKPKEFMPRFAIREIKQYGQNPNPRKTYGERDELIYKVAYESPYQEAKYDRWIYGDVLLRDGGLDKKTYDEILAGTHEWMKKAKRIELDTNKKAGVAGWKKIKAQDAINKRNAEN